MRHFIELVLILSTAPFAASIAQLDAQSFKDRQAASATLKRNYPLSLPAVWNAAETTSSPETYHRAEKFLSPFSEWREAWRIDAEVNAFIYSPDESCKLPILGLHRYRHLTQSHNARLAMQAIVKKFKRAGYFTGQTFYCEPTPMPDTFYTYDEHWMSGINSIRFVARGLPEPLTSGVPLDEIRRQWIEKKSSNLANSKFR